MHVVPQILVIATNEAYIQISTELHFLNSYHIVLHTYEILTQLYICAD